MHIARRNDRVDVLIFGIGGRLIAKSVSHQATQHRVLLGLFVLGPVFAGQIPEHQKLAKREQAQHHVVALHAPALLHPNRVLYGIQVGPPVGGTHVAVVCIVKLAFGKGQGDAEIGFQFGRQRQVDHHIVIRRLQFKFCARAFSFQGARHQHQRGTANFLGGIAFMPMQKTNGQKQQVRTLFFEQGVGLGANFQQLKEQGFRCDLDAQAR